MKSTILKLLGVVLLIALLVRSSFAPKDIDYHYKECPYCEWTGYKTYFLFGLITEKCTHCNGTGHLIPLENGSSHSDYSGNDESSRSYSEEEEYDTPSQSADESYVPVPVPVPVQDNYYQDEDSYSSQSPCQVCRMTGQCQVCDGTGQVMEKVIGLDEMQPHHCRACYGSGRCQGCNGTGYLQ